MENDTHKSFVITGCGWTELKRFFSNKDFIWFDRKDLRDADSLSPQDAKWLRGWTLSPLGAASIFYIGYRKLYDIATVYIGTWLFFEVHDNVLRPLLINDMATNLDEKYPMGILVTLFYFIIVALPLSLASLYSSYFTLRHARRLSWNRDDWKNVESLRKSEQKWFRYNFLPSMGLLVLVLLALIGITSL